VKRLGGKNVDGKVGDVRDEKAFTELLRSLAPVDHVIFSGVDKIIRGSIADADLDEAKHLFDVKFWGSVVVGKGESACAARSCSTKLTAQLSRNTT